MLHVHAAEYISKKINFPSPFGEKIMYDSLIRRTFCWVNVFLNHTFMNLENVIENCLNQKKKKKKKK